MAYHYGSRFSFSTSPCRLKTSFVFFVFLLLSSLSWGQCFKPAINISAKNINVIVGDFNGDGKPDFAATQPHYNQTNYTSSDSIAIFLDQGGGLFDRGTPFFVGGADSLAVCDLNGDGKLDIGAATIIRDPSFKNANATAVGDFNSDGKPDFLVSGNTVTILFNAGNNGFMINKIATPNTGNYRPGVTVGDFNGDNITDLLFPVISRQNRLS